VTGMDIGLVLQSDPPASALVELMVRAEELGFSHGWTFDSHVMWQEPYVIYPRILEPGTGRSSPRCTPR
jgi:alkanesulfonate monooxygenase SsuD/methylene tetrahydromethanopterin reductase-like flavin-dependent oxidoreductase (luciferase family)